MSLTNNQPDLAKAKLSYLAEWSDPLCHWDTVLPPVTNVLWLQQPMKAAQIMHSLKPSASCSALYGKHNQALGYMPYS